MTEENGDGAGPAPLVSVVTAAYNAEDGVRQTVESVAQQSFRDVEHIIVDGGSSDGTVPYLESLGPSVRWISEPDEGIADALNKGFAMARGEYVIVLQAEDTFVEPDSLEKAARFFDKKHDFVSFDVLFAMRDGTGRRFRSVGLSPKVLFKTTMPHQGLFCRRDLFERIGSFDTSFRIAMDYEFFLRAYRHGASVRRIDGILARMPDTGVSSKQDWPSLEKRFSEERRVHDLHCSGQLMACVYAVYWPLYLGYRRIRTILAGG